VDNNIQEFINEIKEDYFSWLKDTCLDDFPRVCDLSSDVLSSYLINKYPEENVKFIRGRFDIWSHYWVEINGKILDFTVIQFLNKSDNLPKFDLSNSDYYQKYFEKYLDSPFVSENLYSRYKKYEEVKCSYIDLTNKSIKFNNYLKKAQGKFFRRYL